MPNQVFVEQQSEALRRFGYTPCSCPQFAVEILAALPKPEFAKAQHIQGAGRFAVEGFIYLPRAKRKLAAMVKRDLREAEENAAVYRRTIAALEG